MPKKDYGDQIKQSETNPYDFNTIQIYDEKLRRYVTFASVKKKFQEEMAKQASEIMTNVDGGQVPTSQFAQKYKEKTDKIVNYVTEMIAANIATTMVERLATTLDTEFTQKDLVDSKVLIDEDNRFPGWFGNFIELEWFGLKPNGRPGSDIEAINTEIKAHTKETEELKVAGISVNRLPPGFDSDEEMARIIAMYKMTLKMQNLLFIKTYEAPTQTGRRELHYEEISLHMVLLLQKVWDKIYDETRRVFTGVNGVGRTNGVIFVETESKWRQDKGTDLGTAKFVVRLNLRKLAEMYEFLELYMYHNMLLPDLRASAEARAAFFGGIRRMKHEWKVKGLGRSPKFNFRIKI